MGNEKKPRSIFRIIARKIIDENGKSLFQKVIVNSAMIRWGIVSLPAALVPSTLTRHEIMQDLIESDHVRREEKQLMGNAKAIKGRFNYG